MQFDNRLKKNNKGFTLLELIVTVVILALVTAPFLSSFASASKTNEKSKRVQESNELSQLIIEQFKASSVDQLIATYKLTPNSYVIDSGSTNYKKVSTLYAGAVSDNTGDAPLPSGFTKGYSADITLTPTKTVVNSDDAVPVIDNLDRKRCVVISANITKYDSLYPAADHRVVTVTVDKNVSLNPTKPYVVTLAVEYQTLTNSTIDTKVMEWNYETVPSIYMLYVPWSDDDVINIQNELYGDELKNDTTGEYETVGAYIIQQTSTEAAVTYDVLKSDNVKISEAVDDINFTSYKLSELVDESNVSAILSNTVLYTNVASGSDKNDTVNGVVKTIKVDTVFNLDVDVLYDGKKVASYNATKTLSN